MILAFDVKSECLKNPQAFPRQMFSTCIDKGLLIRPIGNTIYVMPPYILSKDETIQMGKKVAEALEQVLL
jgi:adenosylmethionine-8-amino-7-oxononanoate aminotransferase